MRRAFTLIELLVVVAIIGILVSLAFPVISRVRYSAKAAAAKADMQSIENAVDQYFAAYRKAPLPDEFLGLERGYLTYGWTMDVDGGNWHTKSDKFSPREGKYLLMLYSALQGSNTNGLNPRETRFLQRQEGRPIGHYMDPWSKGFNLMSYPGNRPYDLWINVSNQKRVYSWTIARTPGIPSEYDYIDGKYVVARCCGPNRKIEAYLNSDDFDDIFSINLDAYMKMMEK